MQCEFTVIVQLSEKAYLIGIIGLKSVSGVSSSLTLLNLSRPALLIFNSILPVVIFYKLKDFKQLFGYGLKSADSVFKM